MAEYRVIRAELFSVGDNYDVVYSRLRAILDHAVMHKFATEILPRCSTIPIDFSIRYDQFYVREEIMILTCKIEIDERSENWPTQKVEKFAGPN